MAPTAYNYDRPWERQPFDTDLSWAIFQEYLGQATRPRTVKSLVRPGATWTQLETLSWEDGWVTRARLYDSHLDTMRRETIEKTVQEDAKAVAARHGKVSRMAVELAELELGHYLGLIKRVGGIGGVLTPRETVAFLKAGVILERLVQDQPTDIQATQVDLKDIPLEDLRTLRRIQQKTGTGG